jgi:sortase A
MGVNALPRHDDANETPQRGRTHQWRPRRLACALFALALLPLAHAGYLHAKATVAQILLERAWQRVLIEGNLTRPWPWADTAPVARLRVARLGIDQIVLSGDSGRTLAFGPGWAPASAPPGAHGTSVISAHRDTHFSFLRGLVRGDRVTLETAHGKRIYRIVDTQVVDARRAFAPVDADADGLLLVTCYPFDAIVPGGPLRYVVSALTDDDARKSP